MIRKQSEEFKPILGGGVSGGLRRWRCEMAAPLSLLEAVLTGSWSLLQGQPGRAAYRVDTRDGPVFVKHYAPGSLWGRLRDFVWRRKPARAWAWGRLLPEQGVRAPAPLGLFVAGSPLPREALLVHEWLEAAREWHTEILSASPADPEGLRRLLTDAAALVGRLHGAGFYHGDLRTNLLFAGQRERKAYLVDLEDLWPRVSRRRRVKNLARLARFAQDLGIVSLRDRWRFLQAYARACGIDLDGARALWRETREATRRSLAGAREPGAEERRA